MNHTLYLSPSGSDANSGVNPALPKRSLANAALAMGGAGLLVLAAGDYIDDQLSVSLFPNLQIQGASGSRVLLGEKVNAFTLHSGSTWKANITTVIPQDRTFNNSNDFLSFVFEWETPEGALDSVNTPYAPAGRTHRMQHSRLRWGTGKDSLAAGQFWYESGVLYLRRTDSSNPNGQDYWIPNQTGATFVKSGTAATNITLDGVSVYFGNNGADFSGCASYTLTNCLFFGNGNEGTLFNGTNCTGTETSCEYAANANDGRGATSTSGLAVTVTSPWSHDNGDEGVSDHQSGCGITYVGGLYESNASGGSTFVQGAFVAMTNPRTRNNGTGISAAVGQPANTNTITGWLSEGDNIGCSAIGGVLNVTNSTITSPGQWALYASGQGDIINAQLVGGVSTPRAGGGAFNVT